MTNAGNACNACLAEKGRHLLGVVCEPVRRQGAQRVTGLAAVQVFSSWRCCAGRCRTETTKKSAVSLYAGNVNFGNLVQRQVVRWCNIVHLIGSISAHSAASSVVLR